MKVALVHDYLKGEGGAEQVLLALHEMYPKAPIYTIFSNVGGERLGVLGRLGRFGGLRQPKVTTFEEKYEGAKIVTSWFDRLPYRERLISPLRFLIPVIWGSFDFSSYDLVISSASWAVTKGFGRRDTRILGYYDTKRKRTDSGQARMTGRVGREKPVEICYCHTPPRYLYGYETSRNWKKHWYIRAYALVVNHFMRMYDFSCAQKVTQFVANSREVQKRIEKFYRRESVIINPPVEIGDRIKKTELRIKQNNERYFLTGGRLELPKNFDLIIKACNELKVPLKIYGRGPQQEYLKSIAGPTVELFGFVSDEERQRLLAGAEAFICAATDEDFGITPVEAMAEGTPVIAYRGAGYTETVVEGKTGVFFESLEVEELMRVMRDMWENGEEQFKPEDCRRRAAEFAKDVFKSKMAKLVNKLCKEK